MKYINISFDDGRLDTYTNAKRILDKYNLKGTINIITDFVNNSNDYNIPTSPHSMSKQQILDCQKKGMEIGCHGHKHENNYKDLVKNIEELKKIGIDTNEIGFASPFSYITSKNIENTGISKLYNNKDIAYIRSGIQVRREGFLYLLKSIIEKLTHGKNLFYNLNKKSIFSIYYKPSIYLSTSIKSYTRINKIKFLINSLKQDECVILLFHSVLNKNDSNYGKDNYYWDENKFDLLCKYISENKDIKVCTIKEIIRVNNKEV